MLHVIQNSGVRFMIHDLRRTFITIAESLDISAYALKRLLNHKMNNDVTAGHIIIDAERLRDLDLATRRHQELLSERTKK